MSINTPFFPCCNSSIGGASGWSPQFVGIASKTVGNTTTETSIVPVGTGSLTLTPSQIVPGTLVRFTQKGNITFTVGSPTFDIKVTSNGSAIMDSTALSSAVNVTGAQFEVDAMFTIYTLGGVGTATMAAQGIISLQGAASRIFWKFPAAAFSLDTAQALPLDMTMTWGTAAAGNTITTTQFLIETFTPWQV